MTIAITGATGNLGRAVVDALLERGVPATDLVLITRSPDKVDVPGAQVRRGDFADPTSLDFSGVDRALIISTDAIGARVAGHLAAIDAAVAAGVGSIAYTSCVNPSDSNPLAVASEHRATEDHLRAATSGWTMLRNSIYAEMLVNPAQAALAGGTHVTNEGDGKVSYVAREDCARAAAAVLASDGHDGKVYDITGGEGLDAHALAALFAEHAGREIAVVEVDDAAYTAGLVEHAGLPEPVAAAYTTFGTGARLGYGAPVSDAVNELTGRDPIPAREVLAAELAAAA